MNEQGAFIATLLDASRKAFAVGAVLRVQEAGPEAAEFVRSWGFNDLVDDAQVRLQHLAEALACGRPQLFALDVEWLAATHAARGIPPALLMTKLGCLRAELEENLPQDAVPTVKTYFEAAVDRLGSPPAVPASHIEADGVHVQLAREFLLAALEGKKGRAEEIVLGALDDGVSIADLHLHVIAKAQIEVGRMWQTGEVTVAEEHFLSRVAEDLLAQLRARIPRGAVTGLSVLTASVSGNLHDIGARVVADHFEMSGWHTIFLGANMPAADLVQAVQDFQPDLVALSVGLAINVRAAASTIAALRAEFPRKPILVGGRPFTLVADLWRDVGADGCAPDATTAVRVGSDLVDALTEPE